MLVVRDDILGIQKNGRFINRRERGMAMLSRRGFMKGLFTTGVVLGSTSLDIYPAHLLSHLENGKAKKSSQLPKIKVTGLGGCGKKAIEYKCRWPIYFFRKAKSERAHSTKFRGFTGDYIKIDYPKG